MTSSRRNEVDPITLQVIGGALETIADRAGVVACLNMITSGDAHLQTTALAALAEIARKNDLGQRDVEGLTTLVYAVATREPSGWKIACCSTSSPPSSAMNSRLRPSHNVARPAFQSNTRMRSPSAL